jgi:hypothetical protein
MKIHGEAYFIVFLLCYPWGDYKKSTKQMMAKLLTMGK